MPLVSPLIGEVFPVCFCYRARSEARERVRDLGLHLVFSYGRLILADQSDRRRE